MWSLDKTIQFRVWQLLRLRYVLIIFAALRSHYSLVLSTDFYGAQLYGQFALFKLVNIESSSPQLHVPSLLHHRVC